MKSKKILITGGGGYIGSIASYTFLQSSFEIIVIDNFSTGFKSPLKVLEDKFGKERIRYYQADLKEDLSFIFEKEKDILGAVHFAASCSVNESMENPGKYFTNNVYGSLNLLQTLLKYKINNLVFSSTCAVYGEAKYMPVDEVHPVDPKNPYGASKKIAEDMITWFHKLQGLNYIILRYFNVCGASDDGLIGDSKKPSSLLVQNVVRGALGIEEFHLTCPKVDTPDKTPIRDYINVVDLSLAHLQAVECLLKGSSSEIINLGTGVGNSVLEIIDKVKKATGVKFDLKEGAMRQGEYSKMIAKITKAKEVLGWEPKRSLEHSVNSLVAWYKMHPEGWRG